MWNTKCLLSIIRMGNFSCDRSIIEYAENIWGLNPFDIPKPEMGEKRVYSRKSLNEK